MGLAAKCSKATRENGKLQGEDPRASHVRKETFPARRLIPFMGRNPREKPSPIHWVHPIPKNSLHLFLHALLKRKKHLKPQKGPPPTTKISKLRVHVTNAFEPWNANPKLAWPSVRHWLLPRVRCQDLVTSQRSFQRLGPWIEAPGPSEKSEQLGVWFTVWPLPDQTLSKNKVMFLVLQVGVAAPSAYALIHLYPRQAAIGQPHTSTQTPFHLTKLRRNGCGSMLNIMQSCGKKRLLLSCPPSPVNGSLGQLRMSESSRSKRLPPLARSITMRHWSSVQNASCKLTSSVHKGE